MLRLGCSALIFFASLSAATAAGDAARTRLEDLFVWKAADELRLPIDQEQKFSEAVRAANARKKAAADRLERATKRLAQETTDPKLSAALAEYRAALVEYSHGPELEFDQLAKILGREKLARYVTLKGEMSEKLKDLLSRPPEKQPEKPIEKSGEAAKGDAPRAMAPPTTR